MSAKDIWQVAVAVIASFGGAGAIVVGLSTFLGKVWADRALEEQKQEYTRLNLEFSQQLDSASRRLQIELDALGHLHKLRTQTEFEKVRELWKRIALLRQSFWNLPKAGLAFVSPDKKKQSEFHKEMSQQFIKRFGEAEDSWSQEELSIPENIADATRDLLKIAQEEAFQAFQYPDPFDSEVVWISAEERTGFLTQRGINLKKFDEGTQALKIMMRKYLKGDNEERS